MSSSNSSRSDSEDVLTPKTESVFLDTILGEIETQSQNSPQPSTLPTYTTTWGKKGGSSSSSERPRSVDLSIPRVMTPSGMGARPVEIPKPESPAPTRRPTPVSPGFLVLHHPLLTMQATDRLSTPKDSVSDAKSSPIPSVFGTRPLVSSSPSLAIPSTSPSHASIYSTSPSLMNSVLSIHAFSNPLLSSPVIPTAPGTRTSLTPPPATRVENLEPKPKKKKTKKSKPVVEPELELEPELESEPEPDSLLTTSSSSSSSSPSSSPVSDSPLNDSSNATTPPANLAVSQTPTQSRDISPNPRSESPSEERLPEGTRKRHSLKRFKGIIGSVTQKKSKQLEAELSSFEISRNPEAEASLSSSSSSSSSLANSSGSIKTSSGASVSVMPVETANLTRLRQLRKTIEELVDTERTYIDDLTTMIEEIMKPMELKKNFMTGETIVTKTEMQKIWSNIALLPPINQALLKAMEPAVEAARANEAKGQEIIDNQREGAIVDETYEGSVQQVIADAFKAVADFFKMYSQYCSNQQTCLEVIGRLCKNSQFEAFLMERAQIVPGCRNLDLQQLVIKPVQRMCKYPLFLREIMRFTLPDHPQFPLLQQAFSKVDEVVQVINRSKAIHDRQEMLCKISNEISFKKKYPSFPIVIPTRNCIKYGDVKRIELSIGKNFAGRLYFFNDIIMFTSSPKRKSAKSFSYKWHCHVASARVIQDEEQMISLGTTEGEVAVLYMLPEQIDEWRLSFAQNLPVAPQ